MAWVTQDLIEVWKSGMYVGEHTPAAVVQVQYGYWQRWWWDDNEPRFPPVHAQIWGEDYDNAPGGAVRPGAHWAAKYHARTEWFDVPNLMSIKRTKDFQQNGVTVCEIVLDAQDFVPKVGALGDAYHVIAPGWLMPDRDYVGPGRPNPRWESSEWSGGDPSRITDSVTIRVWQGFGQPETDGDGNTPPVDGGSNGAWTFRGMIDDVDLDGDPNQITITARNGKLLTDQRVFRAAKSIQLKDPITFWDSASAERESMVGNGAAASSQDANHPARNVVDAPEHCYNPHSKAYATRWRSRNAVSATHMEWIDIRLPRGRYKHIWIAAEPGLECYVGIMGKNTSHFMYDPITGHDTVTENDPPQVDHTPWVADRWIDVGAGVAPGGANGGWPYITKFSTGSTGAGLHNDINKKAAAAAGIALDKVSLGHEFHLGKHSVLRVGIVRKSGSSPAWVVDLHGLRVAFLDEIQHQQFILVDDASEVVKVALRWAGYTHWDVEEAGVRLSDGTNYGPGVKAKAGGRLSFNRTKFLVDIIQDMAKQLGFVFFLADPKDANTLDGIPTFRRDSSLLKDNNYIAAELTEHTMLTGLKVKHTDADRPRMIRVRGKTASARDGGVPLGGDRIKRIMAVYPPPWADGYRRNAGVIRHINYADDQLVTYAMCLYGCFLIALEAALQMHTAVAEIPGHPMIELDDQVSVVDEPTATNSRLWVIKSQDTMTLGEQANWKQTIEGSLLDTRDFNEVLAEVLGQHGFSVYGTDDDKIWVPKIDWNHVVDPHTGQVSGYTSPVVTGKHRNPRSR